MAYYTKQIDGVFAYFTEPVDSAIEISAAHHATLFAGLASGKIVVADANGFPALADRPQPTADQIAKRLEYAVQRHLDATVKNDRGYDSIYTACTYADEPAVAKFEAEGRAARAWRSIVWAYCHQVLDDVNAGRRAIPSAEQLIAELPQIAWPQ